MAKGTTTATSAQHEDAIIEQAVAIIAARLRAPDVSLSSPNLVKQYLICQFGLAEREVFSVLWLDVKNRLLEHEILAYGTLTHCSVYPREIVKSGLRVNASGCIFCHNHPSGNPEPSDADTLLTTELRRGLAMIDTRVLDHIIVAGTRTFSFAENALL